MSDDATTHGSAPPERIERKQGGADPGWYQPAPSSPEWRWWDGAHWTEHSTAGPHPEAVPSLLGEANRYLAKIKSDIGFIALVLKIIVALWILGFVLFFFGLIGGLGAAFG